MIPLWRVRTAAKSAQSAKRSNPLAAPSRWKGGAHIVIASPKNSSGGPYKFKRKSGKPSGAGKASSATTGPLTQLEAAPAAARQRRGDEEFERQLQMALMATQEDMRKSANTTSPAAAEGGGCHSGVATMHRPADPAASTSAVAHRPASLFWAEVFCGSASDGAWVHVDAYARAVGTPASVEASGRIQPGIAYVAAFVDGTVKDVTRRYAGSFVKALRARDEKWFVGALQPLRCKVR